MVPAAHRPAKGWPRRSRPPPAGRGVGAGSRGWGGRGGGGGGAGDPVVASAAPARLPSPPAPARALAAAPPPRPPLPRPLRPAAPAPGPSHPGHFLCLRAPPAQGGPGGGVRGPPNHQYPSVSLPFWAAFLAPAPLPPMPVTFIEHLLYEQQGYQGRPLRREGGGERILRLRNPYTRARG